MESQKNKCKRAQKFSTEEEFLLITLAAEQRKIFENKKADAATWKEKELAWENLATVYSSKSGVNRSGHSLRAKYETLKKKLQAGLPYGQPPSKPTIFEKLSEILGDEDSGEENSDSDYPMNDIELGEEISDKCFTFKSGNSTSSEVKLVFPSPSEKSLRRKNYISSLFQKEKLLLIRAQRTFYEQENLRAQEKHLEEMKTLSAKRELLYLEIAEKRRKLNINT